MGGLPRKYTVIDKIKRNENIDHLLIDSGNFLFSSSRNRPENTAAITKASGIAKIYREMNYDAVNIGPNDLAAGINYLKKLDFLPWVCANFYDNSGKTIFTPYIIKSFNQMSYGIIGLSSQPSITSAEFSYQPWRKILPSLIQELNQKVDCIIVLSSLKEEENKGIAQQFPEIRLLFSSLSAFGNISPHIVNEALITQTADRGRYLGQLYILNPGLHDWADPSAPTMASSKKLRKTIEYRLSRINYLITQNSNNPGSTGTLERQKNTLIKQLEDLENNKPSGADISKSTFRPAFTPLTANIQENRRISEMIKKIKKEAVTPGN